MWVIKNYFKFQFWAWSQLKIQCFIFWFLFSNIGILVYIFEKGLKKCKSLNFNIFYDSVPLSMDTPTHKHASMEVNKTKKPKQKNANISEYINVFLLLDWLSSQNVETVEISIRQIKLLSGLTCYFFETQRGYWKKK